MATYIITITYSLLNERFKITAKYPTARSSMENLIKNDYLYWLADKVTATKTSLPYNYSTNTLKSPSKPSNGDSDYYTFFSTNHHDGIQIHKDRLKVISIRVYSSTVMIRAIRPLVSFYVVGF